MKMTIMTAMVMISTLLLLQGSCIAGLTHIGAALLVLVGIVLVLLAYWVVRREEDGVKEEETGEEDKDKVEEEGGRDNLAFKDSEEKIKTETGGGWIVTT